MEVKVLCSVALVLLCGLQLIHPADGNFFAAFVRIGMVLVKNTYYTRCNSRGVPSNMNCPAIVFGAGLSPHFSQKAAKAYAVTFGESGCDRYVGHCQTKKFGKN